MSESGRYMLVVMPDGYRVVADSYFDQFDDPRSLFGLSVTGTGEHGEPVVVRGNHIARISEREQAHAVA